MSTDTRLSWPRRITDDTPIVGWHCRNCGEEVEHAYQPSLLQRCPNCGGNPQGVRGFDVEALVEQRRERLADQLANHFGPDRDYEGDPECTSCETTEDVHIDPGENLDDLQWRCDDCRRFKYQFWWQPGDHPSLLTREWIETCDDCGAEFTNIYGVSFMSEYDRETRDRCLRCTDPDWLRSCLEADERRKERRKA